MDSLFKIIDKYVGSALVAILSPFSLIGNLIQKRKQKKESVFLPKSILVVRLWTLGEALLTFPMIAELRKKYPQARITAICRNANKSVFELNKDVDEIILFEPLQLLSLFLKFKKFDISIDTEPWFKVSALLSFWLARKRIGFSHGIRRLMYTDKVDFNDRQYEADTFFDLLNPLKISKRFSGFKKIEVSKNDKDSVEKLLKQHGISKNEKIAAISPGAEDALYRMWMPAGFAAAADYIIQKNKAGVTKVLIIGSKKEFELCESVKAMSKNPNRLINLAGKTSKTQLFYLVERLSLLITNDSGPMHVAAVQNVKTISLFGPNLPVRFAPRTKGSISLYHGDEKHPFINVHKGEIPGSNNKKCYEPIEKITIEEVKKAIDKVLK